MLKLNVFSLFFIALLVLSCQDKTNKVKSVEQVKVEIEPSLIIDLNFKTNKEGVFKIMMNNIQVDELQKKSIHFSEDVISTTTEDAIKAEFDANNISDNIIISFGNKEVKEIEIVNLFVSYGSSQINISSPSDIEKYLAFNKFIERDSTSNKIRTKKINGQHNPGLFFKRNLINLLKKG